MQRVEIPISEGILNGDLQMPRNPKALIIFAHGSGSSRSSPRNQQVAKFIQAQEMGTLLFDLLTLEEEQREVGGEYRFNIDLLTQRLLIATRWLQEEYPKIPIGYFGASTGAAAALRASLEADVFAIVSRGGRPDLANPALHIVKAPTLLIVGGLDFEVIVMNQEAKKQMRCPVKLAIVDGATHLFEEKGKLQEVAVLAASWFLEHISGTKQLLTGVVKR
jgi:alpha/beta superfamily hydrolase